MSNNSEEGDALMRDVIQDIDERCWEELSHEQKEFLRLITREGEKSRQGFLKYGASTASLYAGRNTIHLKSIRTEDGQRRKGHATTLLKSICTMADRVGVTLSLTAKPNDVTPGPDQQQLTEWYGKHGFEVDVAPGFEGKGNNMTRLPRASPP